MMVLLLQLAVLVSSSNETTVSATKTQLLSEAPRNYCGLFCVYAVAQQRGLDVEFESLVDPKLLTGEFGSSVGNVIEALDRCNIEGHAKAGMTLEHLDTLTQPALLHVAIPSVGNVYRHWVLYLGKDESGKIRVYDPPRTNGTLTEAELLSFWDGVAVLTEPPSLQTRLPDIRFVVLSLVTVLGVARFRNRVSLTKLFMGVVAAVTLITGILPGTGLFSSSLAIGSIQARFFNVEFPTLDYRGLQQQINQPHVLIDARTQDAFAYSHIPGAINVPVNSSFIEFCEAAESLDHHTPVILYCQSERCGWGDRVAQQLHGRGLENILIYRGGMNDWVVNQR